MESIKNIVDEFKERISNVESQIEYLRANNELDKYTYEYALYNNVYTPKVFFNNIDETIDYVKRTI
ncbi:hypothetical protein ACH36K_15470 [Clostridium sp. MB05]|uniref:hypothetical protein n=1 Tax=Clostridium sp. MB05 TaxID=3376682 RepID=UPI003982B722